MSELARLYQEVIHKVYGVSTFIPKKHISKFLVMEDDLRFEGIGLLDYTNTVAKALKGWATKHNLKYIPINVFCGDWALKVYKRIDRSKSVELSTPTEDLEQELIHNELLVARAYIECNLVECKRLSVVVCELRTMLSQLWLTMYEEDKAARAKIMDVVIPILCDEYNLASAKSYVDIIGQLVTK